MATNHPTMRLYINPTLGIESAPEPRLEYDGPAMPWLGSTLQSFLQEPTPEGQEWHVSISVALVRHE